MKQLSNKKTKQQKASTRVDSLLSKQRTKQQLKTVGRADLTRQTYNTDMNAPRGYKQTSVSVRVVVTLPLPTMFNSKAREGGRPVSLLGT